MNKLIEFLKLMFWSTVIVLAFTIIVSIGTEVYTNIKISNKIKASDVCIFINDELYCRLDYDIKINYSMGEL